MQSSAARAFNLLSAKIHPQLPLTPRESQQLLSLLTSSFRRHLDREHPGAPEASAAQSSRRRKSISKTAAQDTALKSASSHVPISRLFESVLANPLLAHKPSRQDSHPAISALQAFSKNPSQWFRDSVADGSASIYTAFLYADAMRKTSNATATNGIASSNKAGTEIAQWLWASGLETTPAFIENHAFHTNLAALLIQERNERPLWRWLGPDMQRALENAGIPPAQIARFRSRLLKSVVLCKLNGTGGLEDAISAHLHACSLEKNTSRPVKYSEFFTSGASIVSHITANSRGISVASYDAFFGSIHKWCSGAEGFKALLLLQHPSTPDLNPALQYLRKMAPTFTYPKHPQMRYFLVNLSLALARGLLAEDRFADGLWVLDFLKEKFPKEVGWKPSPAHSATEEHNLDISKDELENLRLLETLNV
ncbi:uncharacterized protein BDZ99DRAFT_223543 [Mytilinidion resinicola]|uniref:Uncharacterized protein n=1 Tax=Mytilinidion resinicola TaxID=574789 RepID=A0A6A6Z0M8_9PEZI|nr:uncharacterized protein BDZ99DRAFT_223543 [Mytilinidion resinicola]KAF2813715.1 hypothetical protein BDZ99DRAFT_223543 [Mytilinidion resinicola]